MNHDEQISAYMSEERARMSLAIMLELIRRDKTGQLPYIFAGQAVAAVDVLIGLLDEDNEEDEGKGENEDDGFDG